MTNKSHGDPKKGCLRNIEEFYTKNGDLNGSNNKDPHLHALKEAVPPNHQKEVYFSLRALQSMLDTFNHRNVEMGRAKVSNAFAKTAREQTMPKNIIRSPKE